MGIHRKQVLIGPQALAGSPSDFRGTPVNDWNALSQIALQIKWNASPKARYELTRRATIEKRAVHFVQHDILVEGLQRALEYQYTPQTVRLGSAWITDDDGHEAVIVPAALIADAFCRWLSQEARSAAESITLDEPYPLTEAEDAFDATRTVVPSIGARRSEEGTEKVPTERVRVRRTVSYHQVGAVTGMSGEDALYLLPIIEPDDDEEEWSPFGDEHQEYARQGLRTLKNEVTPDERTLVEALQQQLTAGAKKISLARAASVLDEPAPRVRQRWTRLKHRAESLEMEFQEARTDATAQHEELDRRALEAWEQDGRIADLNAWVERWIDAWIVQRVHDARDPDKRQQIVRERDARCEMAQEKRLVEGQHRRNHREREKHAWERERLQRWQREHPDSEGPMPEYWKPPV